MNVNDPVAVAALEAEVFAPSNHTPWSERLFSDDLAEPGHIWWVAHDEGTIVGYAGAVVAGSEVQISNVAVVESRRREGIAARLLARVTYDGQMLGPTTSVLEVEAGNAAAQALYAKLGYVECGRRPNYYGQGHDALIMQAEAAARDAEPPRHPRPARLASPLAHRGRGARRRRGLRHRRSRPACPCHESSCDETAMAIIDGSGAIVSSVVATSIDFHARFGGVVPR